MTQLLLTDSSFVIRTLNDIVKTGNGAYVMMVTKKPWLRFLQFLIRVSNNFSANCKVRNNKKYFEGYLKSGGSIQKVISCEISKLCKSCQTQNSEFQFSL